MRTAEPNLVGRPRLRARASLWIAAIAIALVSAACTLRDHKPPPEAPRPGAGWPGKTGLSGVNGDPIIDRASVEAFCNWRGRECPIAHAYTDRGSWESMTRRCGWIYDNFAGYPGMLVISQGLVPEGRNQDLAACARGEFDEHWKDFAKMMVERGREKSIVRLGWEFNGDFMAWAATNTEAWKGCYRHAALAIRQVNPKVIFDWTINAHQTPPEICNGNSLNCYPGDDVVDIIGIDNYDMGPSVSSEEEFLSVAALPDGIAWVHAFAKKRHKKFSIGEWGIAPVSNYNASGENAEFIRWMHNWLSRHAADMAYEMYFTSCDGGVGSNLRLPQGPQCKRYNPQAARVYKSLFGGPGIDPRHKTPPPAQLIPPTREATGEADRAHPVAETP